MKHNHLFLALLAMGFVSCVPDRSEDKLQSLTIYDYSIAGKSPSKAIWRGFLVIIDIFGVTKAQLLHL